MSYRKRRKLAVPQVTITVKKPRTQQSFRTELPVLLSRSSRSRSLSHDTPQTQSASSSTVNSLGRTTSSSSTDTYVAQEDEVKEDHDLADILSESDPQTEDGTSLPVRIISYFDIYDYQSGERRVLPMDIDPEKDVHFFGASGFVRPQLLEDEDEDWDSGFQEDESVHSKLSVLQEAWTDKNEIWIRTKYAWYILEYPSQPYRKYFERMKVLAQNYSARSTSSSSRAQVSSTPFVTPRVGYIAQGLFLRSLLMLNERIPSDPELQNVCVQDIPFVVHTTSPSVITWGEEVPDAKGFYKSVFLDGVEYHTFDTIAVSAPAATSTEEDGSSTLCDSAWFAQICYFFDRAERAGNKRSTIQKYFHLRWFSHGSQTILGETANPQGLFLLDECDDNPVETILQKISVRQLAPGDLEPVVISDRDVGSSSFHLSHKWDSEDMTMSSVDLAAEQTPIPNPGLANAGQPEHMQCYACSVRQLKEFQQSCNKLTPGILEIYGIQYHLNDFVYVRKRQKLYSRLEVGQIVDLLSSSGKSDLQVRFFERANSNSQEDEKPEIQRSLLYTATIEKVSAEHLDGHCYVSKISSIKDMEGWLDGPDNFILINHKGALKQCKRCLDERNVYMESERSIKAGLLLRAIDLFSGAGGLTTGMDSSGYVKTCWAVEKCPSAAQSLKVNHEDAVVYNQDANLLLKHAADIQAGKKPSSLRSLGPEREALPPLPAPGEVDLIMGGPPCQPFSGMNRFKRVDDIRQTCIPTILSYVEFYSPKFALIENVTGLLHYRLKGRQKGSRIVGGVEAGMVKFIMRAFTTLGYQCQMRVLNSADYGSPQQRNRVIFWASRLDLPLPIWPKPTHIPQKGHNNAIRRIADIGCAPLASRNEFEDGHMYAPFYAVTVKEAISDLPSWDWENPGLVYPKGAKGPETGKPTFLAESVQWRIGSDDAVDVSGYNYPVRYASAPRTLYQAFCRKGQSEFARVDYHYTELFSSIVVERTVNVPIRPLANFADLPRPLQYEERANKKRICKGDKYWRLDADGQFRTLMTMVSPASKGAYVIHPTDKRILTVRELARAQGFPDHYEFCSVEERKTLQVKDMERQIGNAVPVHLAYALGRALGEGLVRAEFNRQREEDDEDVTERSDVSNEL